MGAYDDAMVKSLTTGYTSYFDDILIKAKVHVKTYWKHDPKTGKLIQVHEHEAEHQGAHVMFNAGHKVRVTSGAHEGKELEIKGYDPDKKVFRTKHADNPNIAISPHRIEHVDPEAGKPDWVKKKEAKSESDDGVPSYKKGAVKAVADGQFVDYFDKDGKKIGNASQAKEQADSDNEEFASKKPKQSSEPSGPGKKVNDHKPDNLVVENAAEEPADDNDLHLDPWEEEEQAKDSKDKEDEAKISKAKKTVAAMSPKERFNAVYIVDEDSPIYKALKDLEDNPFVSMDDVEVSEPNLPSLGVTKLKATNKWAKVSLNWKGSAAWCNGHIATIGADPPIKKLKDKAYCSPYDSDVMEEQNNLDGVIEHLTDQTPEIKPIGVRLFSPLSSGTMTQDDFDCVVFERQGEDKPVMVDKKYHDFFVKKFPKAVFKAEGESHFANAVGVYVGDKMVGAIMPAIKEGQSVRGIKRKIGGKK